MSAQDNTFIDAYGLELSDELQAKFAEPARHQPDAQEPTQIDAVHEGERSLRFDAAAQRRTLRGPHFDMRRVASQTGSEVSAWDAFDTGIIDVGAAWASSSVVAHPALEEDSVARPPSRAALATETANVAPTKESVEIKEEIAETVTPVETQPEAPAVAAEKDTSQDEVAAPQIETPTAEPSSPPAIQSAERFAPVWEVDRFNWPDDIEQLFKAQTEYFDYAGKKLVAASREGLSILAVTSTRAGEGSTTLALCLARAAAGAGAKVGLLDGNLLRSEIGEKLGVDFASGWQGAATGEQPLAEAAITGIEEGITLFPSTAGPDTDIESLADDRAGQVFQAAAEHYDLLIVDAGQADLGDNVKTLDAAIVVRDIRHTSEEETLAVAAALRNCGVKAVGIAENFGNAQTARAAA